MVVGGRKPFVLHGRRLSREEFGGRGKVLPCFLYMLCMLRYVEMNEVHKNMVLCVLGRVCVVLRRK